METWVALGDDLELIEERVVRAPFALAAQDRLQRPGHPRLVIIGHDSLRVSIHKLEPASLKVVLVQSRLSASSER